jgi:hypothetical protein
MSPFAKQAVGRDPRNADAVRGVPGDPIRHKPFIGKPGEIQSLLLRGGMTMRYSNRNARLRREAHRKTAIQVNVAVHYVEGSMLAQDGFKLPGVFDRVPDRGARVDVRSEGTDLIIVGSFFTRMDQEMKVKLRSVDAPKNVHQPSFNTAAVHSADDV